MITDPSSPPASARAKLVVAATFLTLALIYGVWYSYSVLLVALLREFGWSRSVLAGAFSVFVVVHGLSGPGLGWLVGRVLAAETRAAWHLYLAFGVLTAAGVSGSGWVPSVILVRGWFPARIGT